MRSMFLYAAGFVAAAGIGPAMAADLPARPLPAQAAPIAAPGYVPDWAGFYFGFHAGGGWDHAEFDTGIPAILGGLGATVGGVSLAGITIPSHTASGAVFGGHAGYNWQYGQVVGGLEVDYSAADLKETSPLVSGVDTGAVTLTKETKLDQLASLRGRLGYSFWPNVLIYGTAGAGWGHTKVNVNVNVPGTGFFSDFASLNQFGWVAGAGVEWKVWQHILLRAEYLHYDFGQTSIVPLVADVTQRVDVVRGGISYKF